MSALPPPTLWRLNELVAGRIEVINRGDARAIVSALEQLAGAREEIARLKKQPEQLVQENAKLAAQVALEERRAATAEQKAARLHATNDSLRTALARLVLEKRAATDSHRGLPRSPPAPPAQPGETKK